MITRGSCLFVLLTGSTMAVACGENPGPSQVDSAPASNPKCISIADDLIADFKNDSGLKQVDGRKGGFYVYGDESPDATFDPPKDSDKTKSYPIDTDTGNPECSGPGSFHTIATGFGKWGAAVGTDFKPLNDKEIKGTYNASKYKGISFWAKASAPLTGVQVSFPDIYSDAAADPKTLDPNNYQCDYTAGAPNHCSPYLVKFGDGKFSQYQDSKIDTDWKRFDVLFEDTQQDSFNQPGILVARDALDVEHLTMFAIQVNAKYVGGKATPNDFELWVDDVNFIKK